MNREQLHRFISESKGNESNICQIVVVKGEDTVYEDSWRGFKQEDAVNVNSVTKGVMAILAGIAFDMGIGNRMTIEGTPAFYIDGQLIDWGSKEGSSVTVNGKTVTWSEAKGGDDFVELLKEIVEAKSQ